RYDAARDILELHGAAKVPHRNRDLLARMLKLAPSSIHVHESHVGGGFGIRGELYPEDFLVCVAAMRFNRPVKWIEDRRERLIDAIATRLGLEPNEVRRRNAIAAHEMPYHRPLEALGEEIEHDSGDYVGLLDKLLAALDWDKRKAELARRRAEGEAVGAGF